MDKPEALRLAEFCDGNVLYQPAAAELRRLANVEAQRDALLRVLKDCEIALRTVAKSDDEFVMARHQVREVRAVIRAVEGEKT